MQLNVAHYIVFAFVVVIALIYMSNSLASAMAMTGLLAYILIITNNMVNLQNNVTVSDSSTSDKSTSNDNNDSATNSGSANILSDTKEEMQADFSDDYKEYDLFRQSYTNTYEPAPARSAFSNTEKQYSVDLANTMNATRRFHEKRAMEGAVLRNADFYKYHFGDELKVAEDRPWWGRGEY